MKIEDIINHTRNRAYMNGVDRDKTRVKETQEVFTPTKMVNDLLDQLPQELFADSNQPVIDNSCGDGQFLSEALIRKVEAGIDFETALSTIYGVDLMQDNVNLCRERLLCGREDLRHIVDKNIVCADALTYDYAFGEVATFGNGLFEVL
jgi:type I restriction-modification system DNA methylase subunit